MTTCIALLRGINVGRAKRIAMADLRGLVERLGYSNVRTLLNSGNVLFDADHPDRKRIAATIDVALQSSHGFSASVVVVTVAELNAIVAANPLLEVATDPSRHLVAFVSEHADLAKAAELLAGSWAPEAIALGADAAYLWCARGIIASRILHAFGRLTGDAATTRNWATVLKVQALARGSPEGA
jgi:uncharacterized protein (DUF1697 family)